MSAIFSAIYSFFATRERYGDSLTSVFPAMGNATKESDYIIGVS